MSDFLQFILHIDVYLLNFVAAYGLWTYAALFLIIFCETGLIVTPFLPGDSLLFTLGGFAAQPESPLGFGCLFLLLLTASVSGNQLNYMIGRWIGPRVFNMPSGRFFNRQHLLNAQVFYEKNGGKTILIARFIPIVRSFVPFVAGAGNMEIMRYFFFNVFSGILWIGGLLGAGYFFGAIPVIKNNFTLVIYGIILVSILPSIWVFLYPRLKLYLS